MKATERGGICPMCGLISFGDLSTHIQTDHKISDVDANTLSILKLKSGGYTDYPVGIKEPATQEQVDIVLAKALESKYEIHEAETLQDIIDSNHECWVCDTEIPTGNKYCQYHCEHPSNEFNDFIGKCGSCGKQLNVNIMLAEVKQDDYTDDIELDCPEYNSLNEVINSGSNQTCCICGKDFVLVNGQDGVFSQGLGTHDTDGNEILRNEGEQCLAHKKCLIQKGLIKESKASQYEKWINDEFEGADGFTVYSKKFIKNHKHNFPNSDSRHIYCKDPKCDAMMINESRASEDYDNSGYDKDGFDKYGYGKYGHNNNGFDKYGYDLNGFDKDGFDRDGYNRSGYKRSGYDKDGYDRYGYDTYGYGKDVKPRESKASEDYDEYGVDEYGHDKNGYDEDGYHKDGYNDSGFDRFGYDKDGYNRNGRDINGYNRNGRDKDGYDEDGYDSLGYYKDGYDKDGYVEIHGGYDRDGYDKDGRNKRGYDKDGYDEDGKKRGESKASESTGDLFKCPYCKYKTSDDDKMQYHREDHDLTASLVADFMKYEMESKASEFENNIGKKVSSSHGGWYGRSGEYIPADGYDKYFENTKEFGHDDLTDYHTKCKLCGINITQFDDYDHKELVDHIDQIHPDVKVSGESYANEDYDEYGYNLDGYDRRGNKTSKR